MAISLVESAAVWHGSDAGVQSGLDVRDAAVNSLLQEIATLLLHLVEQSGEGLIQHLATSVLPQVGLPQELKVTLPNFLKL